MQGSIMDVLLTARGGLPVNADLRRATEEQQVLAVLRKELGSLFIAACNKYRVPIEAHNVTINDVAEKEATDGGYGIVVESRLLQHIKSIRIDIIRTLQRSVDEFVAAQSTALHCTPPTCVVSFVDQPLPRRSY
jgi:hypothetical protein